MKHVNLEKEQARIFATSICVEQIRAYVDANRANYERFLSTLKPQKLVAPPKRRTSRKGAQK